VKFDDFFWGGERRRNFHQNFEYLSPFDDFSTSHEEGGGVETLSLNLCYACFGLVMGPYKPKTCTTRPKLCLGTTRHILDGKLGSQGKKKQDPYSRLKVFPENKIATKQALERSLQ
jgi:hypothetical protein